MNLYLDIDLVKAGSGGISGGRDSDKTARRAKREYDESFNRMPVGVMGGDGHPDDPDKGPRHNHSEEDSLDTELEEKRQEDNKLSAERKLIPKDDEDEEKEKEPTAKAMIEETLASLHGLVQKSLNRYVINPVEQQFFEEQGYTKDDIIKGSARFDIRTKDQYDSWLMDRMHKSMSGLIGDGS
jgi:hypothetical protein